ncbi:hypothetical protein M5X00_17805 [Paenibacillus alvei]|uniref:hypothetical protein n=1 Tax=Paenibacillus alvei TaxID=44250 RepID=UPI0021D250EB|nr:hypothetical protein [Paenibacillus alvei]MCY9544219.1 hypothetical protein [Paenibacillus alvei]MCY9708740.1 hypothetical protein [Paenibacillus alvei]MCY9733020.1 hypothetical protein [Paenibacillus alvei]MCY9756096.1 hypothetical protein [Paenibacillus alvei]MEC0084645.1 hypothetical protein [Paenibacillus alvei]
MNHAEVAEIAARVAVEIVQKERDKQQKIKRDWRLRNTRLLLKNYRSFVAHCDDIKHEMTLLQHADVLEELYVEDLAVEAIKRSKKRTLAMVRFMERMMNEYKRMCEESGQPEDNRRYKVIEMMFISDRKYTVEEIAECHNIEIRSVYRDVRDAIKSLSVLVFGVDGIRFEY